MLVGIESARPGGLWRRVVGVQFAVLCGGTKKDGRIARSLWEWDMRALVASHISIIAVSMLMLASSNAASASGRNPPTAAQPGSWLVLYNLNNPDSIAWADWYQLQRSIPQSNMLGLSASLNEHLTDAVAAQSEVIGPVRDFLAANPSIEQNLLGIILGYGLPGTFGTAPLGGPGGFAVTDGLQDMYDDTQPAQKDTNWDCPLMYGDLLPASGRLTKATMIPGRYMVARIDAPTLADAMALTTRAKALEDPTSYLFGKNVWEDYLDSALPNGEWYYLRHAVERVALADLPWTPFDADVEQTPSSAFRFGTHDLTGWNDGRLDSPVPGPRVLAYNFNSWGATTVRSTTAEGGRYVPNALAAGYAAAIGSAGEPQCCLSPFPEVFLSALREGWTIGESFYLAKPFDDWMWTLVGDPFLALPHWFDVEPPPIPGDGDINGDGNVDGLDISLFTGVLLGTITDPLQTAAADLDASGTVDDDDAFLILGPMVFGSTAPDVLKGSGDANGDGHVNGADISSFVDMVLNGVAPGLPLRARWGADMDKDGIVAAEDIPLFVEKLLGL